MTYWQEINKKRDAMKWKNVNWSSLEKHEYFIKKFILHKIKILNLTFNLTQEITKNL